MILKQMNVVIAILAIGQTVAQDAAPGRVKVKGTHVSVVLPLGYREAEAFTGFENLDRETSVMFVELPGPSKGAVANLDRKFSPLVLRTRGVILQEKKIGSHKGLPVLEIKGSIKKEGREYIQLIRIYESTADFTEQVQVTCPASEFQEVERDAQAIFSSVQLERDAAAPTQPAYTIDLPHGWKLAKRLGPADLYTESGLFPKPDAEAAITVVIMNEQPRDFRKFVQDFNRKSGNAYQNLKEMQSRFLEIDGNEANLSVVSATERSTKKPITLLQCYIDTGMYVVFIMAEQSANLTKEQFEAVCLSWKLRE